MKVEMDEPEADLWFAEESCLFEGFPTENWEDESGELRYACANGWMDSVVDLVHHGADVNAFRTVKRSRDSGSKRTVYRTVDWDCPLYHAVCCNHANIVEFLARNGAKYLKCCPVPFQVLIPDWNETVNYWLGTNSGSLLQLAAVQGSSAVGVLLDFYQSDIVPLDMFYSLVSAVKAENMESIRAIVDRYHVEPDQGSPARARSPHSLYMLLRFTIRTTHMTKERIPVLLLEKFGQFLAEDGSVGCERLLTLLYAAVMHTLPLTVEKLTQFFVSCVDRSQFENGSEGFDILRSIGVSALVHGHVSILQNLISAGLMDLKQYPNALFECIGCNRFGTDVYETVTWLVTEWGFDPRACNADGMEPIHFAIKTTDVKSVEALILHGADVNCVNGVDGMTPMHMLFNFCLLLLGNVPSVQLIELLVCHGADLSAKNGTGYTALSVLFWLAQIKTHGSRHSALNPDFVLVDFTDKQRSPLNAAFAPTEAGKLLTPLLTEGGDASPDSGDQSDQGAGSVDQSLPFLLQPGQAVREFFERLASRFGLGLLSMGADTLFGPVHWHIMEDYFQRAGIAWKHVPSLKISCWSTVRKSVGGVHFQRKVDQLPLPGRLKSYLKEL